MRDETERHGAERGHAERDSEYLTLAEARLRLPGRPHLSTLHRWRLRGVRGIKLRTCLVGGRRFTRPEWLQEFIEATSHAGDSAGWPTDPHRERASLRGRDASVRRAERDLDADGV